MRNNFVLQSIYIAGDHAYEKMSACVRQADVLHFTLVMLERYVRKPLEGTAFDNYVCLPAKNAYRSMKKED